MEMVCSSEIKGSSSTSGCDRAIRIIVPEGQSSDDDGKRCIIIIIMLHNLYRPLEDRGITVIK
jgi:hypothetical protein